MFAHASLTSLMKGGNKKVLPANRGKVDHMTCSEGGLALLWPLNQCPWWDFQRRESSSSVSNLGWISDQRDQEKGNRGGIGVLHHLFWLWWQNRTGIESDVPAGCCPGVYQALKVRGQSRWTKLKVMLESNTESLKSSRGHIGILIALLRNLDLYCDFISRVGCPDYHDPWISPV